MLSNNVLNPFTEQLPSKWLYFQKKNGMKMEGNPLENTYYRIQTFHIDNNRQNSHKLI